MENLILIPIVLLIWLFIYALLSEFSTNTKSDFGKREFIAYEKARMLSAIKREGRVNLDYFYFYLNNPYAL